MVALSERIFPATDAHGAAATQVNRFADLVLSEWCSPEERVRPASGRRAGLWLPGGRREGPLDRADHFVALNPSRVDAWGVPTLDVPNLFVTDGAAMTSSSCVDPSLTDMALTARACHCAVERPARGAV